MRKHGGQARRLKILQQIHAAGAIFQGQRQAIQKREQGRKELLKKALAEMGMTQEQALAILAHERSTGQFPTGFLERLKATIPKGT